MLRVVENFRSLKVTSLFHILVVHSVQLMVNRLIHCMQVFCTNKLLCNVLPPMRNDPFTERSMLFLEKLTG